MTVKDQRRYFIPESGEILEKAQAYRAEYNRIRKIWWDFIQSKGAVAYREGATGGVGELLFAPNAKIPEGLKKCKVPDKKGNYAYRPRFRSEIAKELAALPPLPDVKEYLASTDFLLDVEFKTSTDPEEPTSKLPVGNPQYQLGIDWYNADGPLLVILPDQALLCAFLKRKHPEVTFINNEDKHDPITTGMREILVQEWDLMEAKFNQGMAA